MFEAWWLKTQSVKNPIFENEVKFYIELLKLANFLKIAMNNNPKLLKQFCKDWFRERLTKLCLKSYDKDDMLKNQEGYVGN